MDPKCILFLLLNTYLSFANTIELTPPIEEIYLNEGDPLEINCTSSDNITFIFPKDLPDILTSQETVEHYDEGHEHRVILRKSQTIYGDTGWYGCIDSSKDQLLNDYKEVRVTPDLLTDEDVKWIYVYVTSTVKYLVESPESFESLHKESTDEAIVGCHPTSPNYKVTLVKDGQKVYLSDKVQFDPKRGFTIKNLKIIDAGYYECKANDSEEIINFYIYVSRKNPSILHPVIKQITHLPVLGGDLRLSCSVEIDRDLTFSHDWKTPYAFTTEDTRLQITSDRIKLGDNQYKAVKDLLITDITSEDEGEYTCTIQTHSKAYSVKLNVQFHDPNIKYLNVFLHSNETSFTRNEGDDIKWVIDFDGYPLPTVRWIGPSDQDIINSSDGKYSIENTEKKSVLILRSMGLKDMGTYTFRISNSDEFQDRNLTLIVQAKPLIEEPTGVNSYYLPNSEAKIRCPAVGYPLPNITWMFFPDYINDITYNDDSKNIKYKKLEGRIVEEKKTLVTSEATMIVKTSGTINCRACNNLGCDNVNQTIFFAEVSGGFGIIETPKDVIIGDNIILTCGASIYNFTSNINWFDEDDNQINQTNRLIIDKTFDEYTFYTHLKVINVSKLDNVLYKCKGLLNGAQELQDYRRIEVNDPLEPYILKSSMNQTENIYTTDEAAEIIIELKCDIEGMPTPVISWWKDNIRINGTDDVYNLINKNTTLEIINPREKNSGKYICRGENRFGIAETFQFITIKGEGVPKILIAVLIFITIICIILVIYFSIKVHREKVIRKQLMEAGLTHFEEGALECLNPELTIDEQAELLPYDKKWEFPREKLKFGKQLGSGAFGVVMKAEAQGICEGESNTTVAVKMVRRSTESTYIRALASELKIMVHLGKHLNVVNLLGACTKNIAKRELLVIVEYCRFGNLHNYLLRHRAEFINQIDPATGKIDPMIGRELLSRSVSVGSNNRIKYAALSFSRSISTSSSNGPELISYTPGNDTESINMSPEGPILSNNSVQPSWRSNYRGDYKDYNLKPICTQDLLSWAFQVARGMEYLSQRKVLHGDLAARNILLAENNVVKICDFGLAKTMYKDDNYKKQGNAPLPIKWMAIESIRDRVFSTQSDIWSFGIVLWEFFTLAETPYPGMEAEKQFQKLVEGYRMEQPEFATDDVYRIMNDCWRAKPTARPTFTDLVDSIGNLLDESVKMHYVDLNTPYIDMNTAFFENRQNDYLMMISSPDHEALSSPHEYVNSPIPLSPASDTSYICMSPTQERDESGIFSPLSLSEKSHFDFPSENKSSCNSHNINSDSDSETVEISPMLKSEDDNYLKPINIQERRAEFARQRQTIKNSIAKDKAIERDSGYCNAPQNFRLIDKTQVHCKDDTDGGGNKKLNNKNNFNNYKDGIIRTQDNYVNIPSYNNEMRKDIPDSFTNPSYVFMTNDKDQTKA